MTLSKIAQLLLGVTLGVLIVAGGAVGAVFLFMGQLTPPTKPKFANSTPKVEKASQPTQPSPQPYAAMVIYYDGLIVRAEPTSDSTTLGVLDFEQRVEVLEASADKKWQKVRVDPGDDFGDDIPAEVAGEEADPLEGWVSAGNLKRTVDSEDIKSNESEGTSLDEGAEVEVTQEAPLE